MDRTNQLFLLLKIQLTKASFFHRAQQLPLCTINFLINIIIIIITQHKRGVPKQGSLRPRGWGKGFPCEETPPTRAAGRVTTAALLDRLSAPPGRTSRRWRVSAFAARHFPAVGGGGTSGRVLARTGVAVRTAKNTRRASPEKTCAPWTPRAQEERFPSGDEKHVRSIASHAYLPFAQLNVHNFYRNGQTDFCVAKLAFSHGSST